MTQNCHVRVIPHKMWDVVKEFHNQLRLYTVDSDQGNKHVKS